MVAAANPPSPRRLSISHLILLIPWVALVIDAWSPIRDNSFLWHIRAGSLQLEAGRVLTEDPFSFTALGEQWRTQSWLAELLYAYGERISGVGFVPPMLLVMSTITFVGIGLIAYRKARTVLATALVLLISTVILISFLVPRPVLFSFALFALVILAWDRPATRWALPLLFWIWASVHGSFVIGLGYMGLSLMAGKEWRWFPTVFVSGLLTLSTAHGLGVIQMLISFFEAREILTLLTEWRRPGFLSVVFTPYLLGLGLIAVGLVRKRIRLASLWVILPFAILGFGSMRAIPPAWLGLTPFVASSLTGLGTAMPRRFSMPAAALFAVVVAVLPFLLADDGTLDEHRFPVAARSALTGVRTFHDDRVGGYLIWAEGPERLVYIDDRAELYGERMAEFVAVRDGDQPWQPVFERDGIEQAILRSGNEVLIGELTRAGWRLAHEDDEYVVLRKS